MPAMLQVTDIEVKKRLAVDNPWWESGAVDRRTRSMPRRAYFPGFVRLVAESTVRRAVVLMGPRRVGKTVMMHQAVQDLLASGTPATAILYASADTPVYTGLSLERLLNLFLDIHRHERTARLYVLFDEIQYHPDWERHLKSLVDSYPDIRFVASGSAAAALRMKSRESGAGRFTDFLLPPLTFTEFLKFTENEADMIDADTGTPTDIERLNRAFVDYINYGGFPEAVTDAEVRDGMGRYVADDIVDKVLLRDLPSLYGISDQQELKRLFSVLAYNTGQEVNLEGLSKASQVAKNTLRKYLEYLEAAFLVQRLYRIDENGRRFRRQTHFKIYLTNPSLRAALFGSSHADDAAFGPLVETAVFAWYANHSLSDSISYARWSTGEVDFVFTGWSSRRPRMAVEIKWSDRPFQRPAEELASLIAFCKTNEDVSRRIVCDRTMRGVREVLGVNIEFIPAAEFCLRAGLGLTEDVLADKALPRRDR